MENTFAKLMKVIQREYNGLYVSIQLTKKCNFRCEYCYQIPDKGNADNEIKGEEWCTIIDKLYDGGCRIIKFTGGEIFCYKDFFAVYKYAWEKGIIITLYTNGYLIDDKGIAFLKKYPPHEIRISIYGNNDESYYKFAKIRSGWDIVTRNITRLVQEGVNVETSIVLNKMNYKFANEIVNFSKSLNIKCSVFTVVNAYLDGNKESLKLQLNADEIKNTLTKIGYWDEYYEKIKGRNKFWNNNVKVCNAGISTFNIDSLGRAYLCEYEQSKKISLLDNLLCQVQEELRKERAEKIEVETQCSFCRGKKVCGVCYPIYSRVFGNGEDNFREKCLWGKDMLKIIDRIERKKEYE